MNANTEISKCVEWIICWMNKNPQSKNIINAIQEYEREQLIFLKTDFSDIMKELEYQQLNNELPPSKSPILVRQRAYNGKIPKPVLYRQITQSPILLQQTAYNGAIPKPVLYRQTAK